MTQHQVLTRNGQIVGAKPPLPLNKEEVESINIKSLKGTPLIQSINDLGYAINVKVVAINSKFDIVLHLVQLEIQQK